ncbi:histidine phosphatase family protein [Metabacillus sp. KIGAM252]|uniref:Histidine phosphatase family protein n=1 Tax=Metabacillus flavus TaxID=2823519 RepID=A0ABS5LGD9_9BACI|nr:histidine phosphatase family protein [Metabacillus flavus]MBS2969822.1 histidine phosphatase family protein [Metabacillus flavus]
MKITIIRHYRVDCPPKKMMTSKEFSEWCFSYDHSPLCEPNNMKRSETWDSCHSSNMTRASETAASLYGQPHITPSLREIPLSPFVQTSFRLPYLLWIVFGRLAWFFSHSSQSETRKQTADRADQYISELESQNSRHVLVVSHGFFISVLTSRLLKHGYTGKRAIRLRNGEEIVFVKELI